MSLEGILTRTRKAVNDWAYEHSITIPLEQSEKFLNVLDKILNSQRMKKLTREK